MLTQSALSLSVAATLASTVAAFNSPALHHHGIRSGHAAHAHKARDFVPVRPAPQARGNARRAAKDGAPRMTKRIRRSETASYLELATDNSTTSASTSSSGTKYTSTAIWWAEAGWVGSCGVAIQESENVVALPLALYPDVNAKSALCGTTVSVTAGASGKTITATVVGASNRDDYTTFSKAAFLALEGDLQTGELAIEYYLEGSQANLSNLAADQASVSSAAAPTTTTTTTQAPKPTTTTTTTTEAALKTAAVVKAAAAPTTSSPAPQPTTTAAASSSASTTDDGEWVCDSETSGSGSSAAATTSSKWVAPSAAVKVASTSEWVAPSSSAKADPTTSQWVAPTTTTTQAQQTSSKQAASTQVADTSSGVSLLAKQGITGFLGDNSNAILSWYNTDSSSDSTNGNSWCGFPYSNSVPGFAPSLKTMLSNYGGNYEAAATAYCGLEAVVTTPDGKSATLYIADAFDDTWVLTPSSLDIIHGSFEALFGSYTDNKNDVVKGATWKFTGNRNDKYKFKSTTSLS